MKSKETFREVQKPRQLWIWLLVVGIAALAWTVFVWQVVLGHAFGSKPAPDLVVWIIWLVYGLGFPLFFYSIKLVVEVRDDCIYAKYFPLWSRRIPFRDIKRCEPRTYRPMREYGGWGIKWTPWSGWAYNVSGNRGVQLELENGKRLLIGSQKPEELAQAIIARLTFLPGKVPPSPHYSRTSEKR